ncbi:Putative 2,3-bisphosphoglycerate-dependent phosphoglycerate mutase [Nitrosotalea devaniterrae]|uniref:2,3-bisphosphoglycerate-dependent phosphoglycerate mutase n=1 Tax=Nitrosotalea devaniterrae TaxID=1078905 RepID=A0A128A112_9ARCH|nr:Putative 2,3-bisphosphoglycerate-dependent phosphoglycerate mutase [Candidatus Nitrosotalea devanaterra]
MPLVIFLRHGQAKNNVERILAGRTKGFPLTDLGVNQAEQIGNFLKSFNISKIYCSPIERAEHTAKIVADKVGLDCTIDERLTEIEMGKFSGMHYDTMFEKHGNVFLKFYQSHPVVEQNGIETFASVKNRVLDMVSHCSKKHDNETVLLVTHMDPIKSMISNILQPRPESLYEMIIRNASLTILKNEQSTFSMVAINSMNPERYSDE